MSVQSMRARFWSSSPDDAACHRACHNRLTRNRVEAFMLANAVSRIGFRAPEQVRA